MRIIAGAAKGRRLKTLPGFRTRPTADRVKEAVFSALASRLPGANVLDACAGSGALGLEALSRGAASALFIEADRRAAEIVAENLAALQLPGGRLLRGDALKLLPRLDPDRPFDLIFLDPPYETGLLPQLLSLIARCRLLAEEGLVIAETKARSREITPGPAWQLLRESRYGDTAIHYLSWSDIQGGH